MMRINLFLLSFCFLLTGCFKTVHDDIPSNQIAMKSSAREKIALEKFHKGLQAASEGNFDEAFKVYAWIGRYYLETDIAPKVFHTWGSSLKQLGRYEQAFEKLKFVTKNYISYNQYNEVLLEEFDVACKLMQRYEKPQALKWLSWFKDAKPAIDCFNHVVMMAPRSESAPKALLLMSKLEYASGNKQKAIEALDRLIENYPNSESVPEAYLLQAEIYLSFVQGPQNDQGMTQKAILCYEDYLQVFGQDPTLQDKTKIAKDKLQKALMLYAESRLVLGDFFLYRRSYPQGAVIFYNEARLIAPISSVAEAADHRIDVTNKGAVAPMTWADRCFGRVIYKPSLKK